MCGAQRDGLLDQAVDVHGPQVRRAYLRPVGMRKQLYSVHTGTPWRTSILSDTAGAVPLLRSSTLISGGTQPSRTLTGIATSADPGPHHPRYFVILSSSAHP